MVEYIKHNSLILAIIIRAEHRSDGISFYTPGDFSQQLGSMNRPAGYQIPPHIHNPVSRQVLLTKEVLIIKSGVIRVDFYDDYQVYLHSRILRKSDIILLAHGGHGFTFIEAGEIVEVKQGPYAGEQDKTRFQPVSDDFLLIKDV